jgi:hypothetical protein
VEAATDLGAARHEVSAVQRYDTVPLLSRKVLWPLVWPSSLIVI